MSLIAGCVDLRRSSASSPFPLNREGHRMPSALRLRPRARNPNELADIGTSRCDVEYVARSGKDQAWRPDGGGRSPPFETKIACWSPSAGVFVCYRESRRPVAGQEAATTAKTATTYARVREIIRKESDFSAKRVKLTLCLSQPSGFPIGAVSYRSRFTTLNASFATATFRSNPQWPDLATICEIHFRNVVITTGYVKPTTWPQALSAHFNICFSLTIYAFAHRHRTWGCDWTASFRA
jgi:hypothetical protein